MLTLTKKNVQLLYTLVQILYWMAFGLMFSFASAYLQGKGFSNREIGLALGCSYGISTVLQPSIASILQRMGIQSENAVEYLDLIPLFLLEKSAHLGQHPALGIDHHERGMSLEQLGREPEPGFSRAGRADYATVQVAGVGRDLRPGIHGEKFRPGQNDIVFKLWIDKGLDVFFRPP